MWLFVFAAFAVGLLAALSIAARRNRPRDDRTAAATARAKAAYDPALLFVSPFDGAFVGLCFDRGMVALSDGQEDRGWRLQDLAEVELMQDGHRVARAVPGSRSGLASPEGRVRELSLRIVVKDPGQDPYVIRFLDWPAPGLDPSSPALRDVAANAGQFYDRLADGLVKVTAA